MLHKLLRWVKHRWADGAQHALTAPALARIQARIAASEVQHSGEIRVCVEAGLPNSYLLRAAPTPALLRQRAIALFGRLRVWDTEHNNGVLIYLCVAEHAIELVADRGIDRHVSREQWSDIVQRLSVHLRADQWEAGLNEAIDNVHGLLVQHAPTHKGDTNPNELPDAPVVL